MIINVEPTSVPWVILPMYNGTKTTQNTLKTQDLNIFNLVTSSNYNMVSAFKVSLSSEKAKELVLLCKYFLVTFFSVLI